MLPSRFALDLYACGCWLRWGSFCILSDLMGHSSVAEKLARMAASSICIYLQLGGPEMVAALTYRPLVSFISKDHKVPME